MKPEYQALKDELLEKELSRYAQPRETISIPYLLKGKCYGWTSIFVQKFPHLKQVCGFYGHGEHFWCVDVDGTIVDPTIEQFHDGTGDPAKYRVLDESVDRIFLGKCMNCGWEIYGLKSEGHQSVCRPGENDPDRDCQAELERYYNGLTSGARR